VSEVLLAGLIAVGIIVLTPVSDRIRLPLPVVLTVFGLVLAFVFQGQPLQVNPDLILPIVLPPLLFAATQRATFREYRDEAASILILAVGLTVASCVAVAVVAHALGVGWGPAFVLGAVVSPPDPVAATAVARRLRLPSRLVTILEGEGMFNDATALVLYGVAITAVLNGQLSSAGIAVNMVLALVVGVGVGLVAGWATRVALGALHEATTETTVTVVMPFAVYLVADEFGGSGVLAVLTLGLYLRSFAHPSLTSAGWLLGRAVWRFADYLITSVVFVLIGFELTAVLENVDVTATLVRDSAAVIGLLIVLRLAWMFGATALARFFGWAMGGDRPHGSRETFIVGWSGMRGVVTVAAALAIPVTVDSGQAFPDRDELVVVALTCVLVTLVMQGLTLAPLVRALGVGRGDEDGAGIHELRERAARAGLDAVRARVQDGTYPESVVRAATLQYEGYLAAQEAFASARDEIGGAADENRLADLLREASEAERDVVLDARRRGMVSPAVADEVLEDVESRSVRDVD